MSKHKIFNEKEEGENMMECFSVWNVCYDSDEKADVQKTCHRTLALEDLSENTRQHTSWKSVSSSCEWCRWDHQPSPNPLTREWRPTAANSASVKGLRQSYRPRRESQVCWRILGSSSAWWKVVWNRPQGHGWEHTAGCLRTSVPSSWKASSWPRQPSPSSLKALRQWQRQPRGHGWASSWHRRPSPQATCRVPSPVRQLASSNSSPSRWEFARNRR